MLRPCDRAAKVVAGYRIGSGDVVRDVLAVRRLPPGKSRRFRARTCRGHSCRSARETSCKPWDNGVEIAWHGPVFRSHVLQEVRISKWNSFRSPSQDREADWRWGRICRIIDTFPSECEHFQRSRSGARAPGVHCLSNFPETFGALGLRKMVRLSVPNRSAPGAPAPSIL